MNAEELQAHGVKLENLTHEYGEMNIIVQQFPSEEYDENDNDDESPKQCIIQNLKIKNKQ